MNRDRGSYGRDVYSTMDTPRMGTVTVNQEEKQTQD